MLMKQKLLVILLVFGLVFGFSLGAIADELNDLQSSKENLEQKKEETKEKLDGVEEDKSATKEDLEALQSQIGVLQEDIAKLQTDLSTAETNLSTQQEEYDAILVKLEASQAQMKERVRSVYINGDISYWEVLFSSSTIGDFLSNFTFFEKIIEQDQGLVGSIKENKALAEEKLAQLEATKNQIASIKSSKEGQENQLNAESDQKDAVLASLEEDEAYYEESLAAFEAESANVQAEIQAYYAEQEAAKAAQAAKASAAAAEESNGEPSNGGESPNSGDSSNGGDSSDKEPAEDSTDYSGTGSMRWPVSGKGRISSNYGYRSRGNHTGIDIAISKGTPVLAADSGRVILVKRLTYSYGQYVVIDHGGSISTLYAHMSAIHVSQGQTVSKGQQVGAVGSTGNSTGPHLHFEVRINGRHTNPWGYVSQP